MTISLSPGRTHAAGGAGQGRDRGDGGDLDGHESGRQSVSSQRPGSQLGSRPGSRFGSRPGSSMRKMGRGIERRERTRRGGGEVEVSKCVRVWVCGCTCGVCVYITGCVHAMCMYTPHAITFTQTYTLHMFVCMHVCGFESMSVIIGQHIWLSVVTIKCYSHCEHMRMKLGNNVLCRVASN